MPQAIPRITVDFAAGNTIEDQIEAMLGLAYKIDCFVQARLNDVLVVAPPMYDYNGSRRRRRKAILGKYEIDLAKQLAEVRKEWTSEKSLDHSYTTHPTYTGPGCAVCGREEAEHQQPEGDAIKYLEPGAGS